MYRVFIIYRKLCLNTKKKCSLCRVLCLTDQLVPLPTSSRLDQAVSLNSSCCTEGSEGTTSQSKHGCTDCTRQLHLHDPMQGEVHYTGTEGGSLGFKFVESKAPCIQSSFIIIWFQTFQYRVKSYPQKLMLQLYKYCIAG